MPIPRNFPAYPPPGWTDAIGGSKPTFYAGSGAPLSFKCNVYDYYLDYSTGELHQKTLVDTWTLLGTLPGSDASSAPASVSVAFTDGDTLRRVTVTDAACVASSKIIGAIVRPDQSDEAADKGYLYHWNVTRRAAGAFDVVIAATAWGLEDPVLNPPNETIEFVYTLAA